VHPKILKLPWRAGNSTSRNLRGINALEDSRNLDLFTSIQQQLQSCRNTCLQSFLPLDDIIQNMDARPSNIGIAIHVDIWPNGEHRRKYNLPEYSEYPEYRIRSPEHGGLSLLKRVHGKVILVTNQHVIPYNACLS
jgi:hypothetical protein